MLPGRFYDFTENPEIFTDCINAAFSNHHLVFFSIPHNHGGVAAYHQRKLHHFYADVCFGNVFRAALVRIFVSDWGNERVF